MFTGKTGRATTDWSLGTTAGSGSAETGEEALLASVEAAIRRALADRGPGTGPGADAGAIGNRPESLDTHTWINRAVLPVASLPPTAPAPRMTTLCALQEWEGYVVAIEEDAFVARLVDVTAGASHESEEAFIPMEEISAHDAAGLAIGGIFRWVIGHERSPEGASKRVSRIVFRDLPRMTDDDLRAAGKWARRMTSALDR